MSTHVAHLFSRLQKWQEDLPELLRLNVENLHFHKGRGQGRTFVALHLGYFHYATLLSFHFLDQSSASIPFATIYAERCRQHASAYSDLLKTSYELGECEGMHNIVGHMTVVSSSVLLHTLLFGAEEELDSAKRQLESNFNILVRLKAWWPSVAQMTDRLFLFQRICLRTVDNHTHKIDHWMVKFLLEHAILLEDKSDLSRLESTSPQEFASPELPELNRLSERGRFTKNALSGLRACKTSNVLYIGRWSEQHSYAVYSIVSTTRHARSLCRNRLSPAVLNLSSARPPPRRWVRRTRSQSPPK